MGMKIKYKWILLGLTIIVIVGLIVSFITKRGTNDNTTNVKNDTVKTYKFKIFEYTVPKGLTFSSHEDKRFKINGNGWHAIVGILYDQDKLLYTDADAFQETVKKAANIVNSDVITIDDTKVITFQNESSKSLVCYFATNYSFDYKIEIFNDDGSYKTDALNEIIEPLLRVKYKNDGSNDFYAGYFTTGEEKKTEN